ncbi:single-stranded DNA-binding protein [Actinosynnema sp. NPDC047251]|uniref:Single-stranded DNA-binding protein n=1 Tax=Saccharothrix espanaensis (strain ATCC 51144 / DSM 44229 / JCM 9112 / NBRC 15066 / NRRL 15764) TaxID=1179773 RepID=K0JS51_SACES|nr:single-stranded DNA-binding protein [Saccharothrix espanaensis]CCH28646.1 hypothetical protein BN6_13200 [Saccharothrix espanaensis DSM 44229]
MAYNDTRITVCGTVASKIAHTKVGTGFSRVGFRIHSREQRFDRGRDDWIAGPNMFLMVTCWRELADNVHASLNRGDPVVVHGKVRVKEFNDAGRTSQFIDIEAIAVGPNLASCTAHPIRDAEGPIVVPPRREDELPLAFAGLSLNRPGSGGPDSGGPDPGGPDPSSPDQSRRPGPGSPSDHGHPPVSGRPPEVGPPPEPNLSGPADPANPAHPPVGRPSEADQPKEVSKAPF